MSSIAHDDIAYYQDVVDDLRAALAKDHEPSGWSDSDKLRMLAAFFDEADIVRGVTDQREVQEDLRRMANLLENA